MLFENSPDILTFEETRSALRIGKNTLLELLWNGDIHAFKIGKCWRIPRTELARYVQKH